MQMWPDHKPALERHMHGLQICGHEAEAQRGEGKPVKASGAAPGADAAGQDRLPEQARSTLCRHV